MTETWTPVKGNLVHWLNGAPKNVGIVIETMNHTVKVQFDSGEILPFGWPSKVINRLLFKPGDRIQLRPKNEMGVVIDVIRTNPIAIYEVSTTNANPKVEESGLRPQIIRNPAQLLRQGEIHEAKSVNLLITAKRLLFDYQFNEFSSLSNSRVEIKPHQVAVLHRVATSYPYRFLLADEVGLGKTIEAGMIIKELKARGLANRVLIIAPSGLVGQWQKEMVSKFGMVFSYYNKEVTNYLKSDHPDENVWTLKENIVTSATFVSLDEERQKAVALVPWDLVVIDEAHHARKTKDSETQLYKLVERLARLDTGGASGLLFLTATPMQLDQYELYSLVDLLDPALFTDYESFDQNRLSSRGLNLSVKQIRQWEELDENAKTTTIKTICGYLNKTGSQISEQLETYSGRCQTEEELYAHHKLSEILIRNRKANIGGFMPRHAGIISVEMSDEELKAYNAVRNYASEGYTFSQKTNNNALGFVMTTFQKLNSSSSYTVRQSLMRRIKKLQDKLPDMMSFNGIEDNDIEEKTVSDALGDTLGVAGPNPIQEEIEALASVVMLLDSIKTDSKARELVTKLNELLSEDKNAKVLIFTQFRDTQEYLKLQIPAPWNIHLYYGGLKPLEKDAVVDDFRDGTGLQIMISTEAGGEGRNFQFCHIMVNYDLPWNPMKVEQRIGRLDRIGQKNPVIILNFKLLGTIEERVLEVLDQRIRIFEETVGGLDPILGEVENEIKNILLGASRKADKAFTLLGQQLEEKVRAAKIAEQQMADFIMDSKSFRKDEVDGLLNHRGTLDNKTMKCFILGLLNQLGASIKKDPDIPEVYLLKYYNRFLEKFPNFKENELPWRATFTPSTAIEQESVDFLAFGHRLVDALMSYVQSDSYLAITSYRIIKTNDTPPTKGWFFTYVLEFEGVTPKKELFSVFIDETGKPGDQLSTWLLDRCCQIKREDWKDNHTLDCDSIFEEGLKYADARVLEQLTIRREALSVINTEQLNQQKSKVERIYNNRKNAAEAKVEAMKKVFDRVSQSQDPEVLKIVPVWAKNLENANKHLEQIEKDKTKSIIDLDLRREVSGKYSMLTASAVEILPSDLDLPESETIEV